MKYKEYAVEDGGLEKRLGVLGEIHIYTPEESSFARHVVPTYDTVGMEGSGKPSLSFSLIGLLYVPTLLAYALATDRFPLNDTSKTIAQECGKRIIHLEENEGLTFSFMQKLALATVGALSIPFSPFDYARAKRDGDSYIEGTIAYEKRMERKKKNGPMTRLCNYAFKANLAERDEAMAEKTSTILQTSSNNFLVVCGQEHFDGVVGNLSQRLKMRETRDFEEAKQDMIESLPSLKKYRYGYLSLEEFLKEEAELLAAEPSGRRAVLDNSRVYIGNSSD